MKEAERAWRGINVVDQQMYLKDTYLKDQLKWPPRVSGGIFILRLAASLSDAQLTYSIFPLLSRTFLENHACRWGRHPAVRSPQTFHVDVLMVFM